MNCGGMQISEINLFTIDTSGLDSTFALHLTYSLVCISSLSEHCAYKTILPDWSCAV